MKRFGSLVANDHITLDIAPGEVHGLLGENGAGKSTLMKILFGLLSADAGRILVGGQEVTFRSPRDAIAAGIAMAQQELTLAGNLSIVENIALASAKARVLRLGEHARRLTSMSDRYGLRIGDPFRLVRDLSVGEAQRVEILKAIDQGARLLILDEPTSRLTPPEVAILRDIVAAFGEEGGTVVLVSHKLDELIDFCDRITVCRAGAVVAEFDAARLRDDRTTGQAALAEAMVGREVQLRAQRRPGRPGAVALRLQDTSVPSGPAGPGLHGVSLDLHAGEIVGIAGVAGNGQSELISLLAGLTRPAAGRLMMGERDVTRATPWRRRRLGLGCLPEDRSTMAILPDMTLAENAGLHLLRRSPLRRGAIVSRSRLRSAGEKVVEDFSLRGPHASSRMATLSGGSQQKVLLARELALDPSVLVVGQPTAGLDVGAIEYVHRLLLAVRDRGTAVLLISNELSEVMSLSDRVAVLVDGRLTAPVGVDDVDLNRLGLAMAGARDALGPADAATAEASGS